MPFDDKRINEVFKLRDFKHGSKHKKLLENPNYKKKKNSESLDWRRREMGSDKDKPSPCHKKGISYIRGKCLVLFHMFCNNAD